MAVKIILALPFFNSHDKNNHILTKDLKPYVYVQNPPSANLVPTEDTHLLKINCLSC